MTATPMLWTPEANVLSLRPYQVQAIEALRQAFRLGHKRIILCAPTGSGKTEMAIHLVQEARDRGSRVAFVADRITLVQQTSRRLTKYGVPHGVAQASNTRGRREPIQVCSAQTIEARDYWNALDILIIDEAHTQRKAILEFAREWGGPVIGLSATPLTEGLGQHYSTVVNACTTDHLLTTVDPDTGKPYLAPLQMYAATEIDMSGARKNAGEWTSSEVRTRGSRVIGDIVSEWERHTRLHFGGPVKTLLFSADTAHGEDLCRAFQAAGHDFRQSTYRDGDVETAAMVNAFQRGEFTGLVSVEKFVKGFDVPDVLCLVGARPYSSSFASVIQQMGRGMRAAQGKDYCLYLDHAGNVAGWYEDIMHFWSQGVDHLDYGEKKDSKTRSEGSDRLDVVCACGFVIPPGVQSCPSCGRPFRRKSAVETVPGRMEQIATAPGSRAWAEDEPWTWQQISRLALDRRQGDVEAARKTAAGYYKGIYGKWPARDRKLDPCDGTADDRVTRKVQQGLIAWAKRDAKRKKMGV